MTTVAEASLGLLMRQAAKSAKRSHFGICSSLEVKARTFASDGSVVRTVGGNTACIGIVNTKSAIAGYGWQVDGKKGSGPRLGLGSRGNSSHMCSEV
jgi:hypothetical protein